MNITRKVNNLPLKRKMMLILLAAILIVSVAFFFTLHIIQRSNDQLIYESIAGSLSYAAREMNNQMVSIDSISSEIYADSAVQKNLQLLHAQVETDDRTQQLAYDQARKELYDLLNIYLQRNRFVNSLHIFTGDMHITSFSFDESSIYPEEGLADWRASAAEGAGGSVWYTGDESAPLLLLREVRQIEGLSLQTLGVLVMEINLDKIVRQATSFNEQLGESAFVVLDGQQVLYNTEHTDPEDLGGIPLEDGYEIINHQGDACFAVIAPISQVGWKSLCMVPYNRVFHPIRAAYTLAVVLFASVAIGALLLSTALVQNVTKHFHYLSRKIAAFRGKSDTEPLPVYDYAHRLDEVGQIHSQFDSMAQEIEHLINENYLRQLLIQEARINALTAQINPHFLYNTLHVINWRAMEIGETQISQTVEALGKLLRAALQKSDGLHTLEKELELVESYITIQKIRYEERLVFRQEVDESLLNMEVPKLSIQPLVENAIKYSVESNPGPTTVSVRILREDGFAAVYVENDGSRFEENLLQKLLDKEIEAHGTGVGLVNIHTRVQLTYGEGYGVSLYNREGLAVAEIRLPGPAEGVC